MIETLAAAAPLVSSALNVASFGYQMYKDNQTWKREDNAFQRATKDMDLAGLNTFNSGNVGQSASSQSSALQAWMSLKQVQQRDRELRMMEAMNEQNILLAKYGELARKGGTELAEGVVNSAKKAWKSMTKEGVKNNYTAPARREAEREYNSIPNWNGR